MNYLYLAVSVLANVSSSLLIKYASHRSWGNELDPRRLIIYAAALGLLGITFICYSLLVRAWPVGLAYALTTLTTLLGVLIFDKLLFNATYTPSSLLGITFLVIGMVLVARDLS